MAEKKLCGFFEKPENFQKFPENSGFFRKIQKIELTIKKSSFFNTILHFKIVRYLFSEKSYEFFIYFSNFRSLKFGPNFEIRNFSGKDQYSLMKIRIRGFSGAQNTILA